MKYAAPRPCVQVQIESMYFKLNSSTDTNKPTHQGCDQLHLVFYLQPFAPVECKVTPKL